MLPILYANYEVSFYFNHICGLVACLFVPCVGRREGAPNRAHYLGPETFALTEQQTHHLFQHSLLRQDVGGRAPGDRP
jgi:hypothetical protein